MAETSMRGTRLGALSYERDEHVAPAERRIVRYVCPEGHASDVPYFVDADEIPREWTCRCGEVAIAEEIAPAERKPERAVRTHWDMLLERRSIADLEELLEERLALLDQAPQDLPKSA
ncbi:MAG TPA: RNA polymerase-binding protein RbpA [Candidatus Nanopelagicales bacterium]|nr:RNA polymerase-binding protein RbpA [Candidatus Nanopelagicales bacterium]